LAQDESRFQLLKELVEGGFAGQICLGHDMTNKIFGTQAGAYGYTRFPTFVPRRMKEEGMDLAAYHQMTVENPARILAY
jgi:phosphotriesterase-related protein